MAVATAYTAFDMNALTVSYGTPYLFIGSQITMMSGNSRVDYFGFNLTYSSTVVTGGTVTGFDSWTATVQNHMVSGLQLNAVNVYNFLTLGDANGLMKYAFLGNDTFNGSSGNDVLNAYDGNDFVYGNAGDDLLNGGTGNDRLFGGSGNDILIGGAGDDFMDGGAGIDWVYYDTAAAGVKVNLGLGSTQNTAGGGLETLISVENLLGSNFNDIFTGNALANTLYGGAGNDSLIAGDGNDILAGGIGNDVLNGGLGIDWAYYNGAAAGVTVNLGLASAQNTVGNGLDTLLGIENLLGSRFNDVLSGNVLANVLQGGAGVDRLSGGAGNDVLVGGSGRDALIGGAGNDLFDFNAVAESVVGANRDVIVDFVRGADRIDLSTIDAKTTVAGNDTFTFIAGASFTVAGQVRFANGILYGNTDGNLATAEFEIAIAGMTAMGAADFVL